MTLQIILERQSRLDPESEKIISAEYLKANAAEYSSAKTVCKDYEKHRKSNTTTDHRDPHIFSKNHHEISQDVIKRESIGSLSNCLACHTTAEKGIYDDDNVKIPK